MKKQLATHKKILVAKRYTTVAYGLRQPAEWILASEDGAEDVDVKGVLNRLMCRC